MKILWKITLRQMKQNLRRTVITVLGVIISVAMFTAVASLSGSFFQFLQEITIAATGEYEVSFRGLSNNDLETLTANENVKGVYTVHQEGAAKLDEAIGGRRFFYVWSISTDGMEQAGIRVTEGRLPENDSEILLSQTLQRRDDSRYHIGDTITLSMGERRFVDSDDEDDEIGLYTSYTGDLETFRETGEKMYTVVGFGEMLPLEGSSTTFYGAVTGLNLERTYYTKTLTSYVAVNRIDTSVYDWGAEMGETLGAESVNYNTVLLLYHGVDADQSFQQMMSALIGILAGIIFVGSVALIYNAFAISISERSFYFGLLSSVGATKRQKRRMVLAEGLVILALAVPLGIAGGLLGLWAVFAAVNPAVASLSQTELSSSASSGVMLHVAVSPWAILAAVLLSIGTVLVSVWIPARRASRITPLEAIRQTKDVKLTQRDVKTSKLTKRLFGFEGELAAKNRKRNRKRYRITIFSFVISLTLFLSASSFTTYLTAANDMATDSIDYDLYVTVYLSPEDDTNADDLKTCRERAAELVTRVKAIDGIEDMTENKTGLTMNLALEEDRYTDRFRSLLEKAGCTTGDVSFRWNAIDDDTLRRYCETVGVDYDTMTDVDHPAAILINDMVWQNGRTFTDCSALAVSSGDTLPLSYYSYEDEQNHDTSITLAAVTGETVTGISNQTNSQDRTVHLVISQAVYDDYLKLEYSKSNLLDQRTEDTEADMEYTEMSPLYTTLYLKTENPEDVAEELDTIEREMVFREGDNNHVALIVSNEKQQRQTVQQVLFLINTFSYVFIGLISAIGVANIFNTISTSILLRKREFAMLKSVGMTMRSFHKMLLFESLLYGIYSLLWGLPISFGVMGLLYWAMRDTFQMAFLVPWMQVAIGVAAIFLIVLLTVFYAAAKVRREHIMEGLRVRSA